MKKRTQIKRAILGIFVGLLALGAYNVVENVFPNMCIKPWRQIPAENKWRYPNGYLPQDFGLEGQKLSIKSPDNINLSAWLIDSKLDTTFGTVVMLHGISNCKESNLPRARMLAEAGYASLLLDLRAHGQSEGEYCTFGFYEKNDLKAVADTLESRYPDRPIAIWGASLGGAIAYNTLAYDHRYSFGIIESTFDEFPKVVAEYGADFMFGLKPQWILNRVIKNACQRAKFDAAAVNPVDAAATLTQPVLVMHGDQDDKIPMSFGKHNFDAIPHENKEWVSVSGARHNNLWETDGKHLQTVLYEFLDKRKASN
ncbi:MAG: alpha/beta hydrolase [Saprospiraceae bacterium]|nr:alpha/beta hydrolase [Saprospiraceae bacterium]MCB9342146.1 alpha/beta hydrolase [Lewinellaceae bacterium]